MKNKNKIVTPFPDDSKLLGTWVFNDTLQKPYYQSTTLFFNLDFECDSKKYKQIIIVYSTEPAYEVYFNTEIVDENKWWLNSFRVFYYDSWLNSIYQTITIANVSNVVDIETFNNWVTTNATKQEVTPPTQVSNKAISLENLKVFKQECDKTYAIKGESGNNGGVSITINQPSTATNGTLTQEQLTTLQENDLNYIIFNNEIYSLNDKTHTADTLTYSHVGFENGKHLLKTISITVSTRAWVLNTTEVSSGGSGGNQLYEHNIRIYNAYSAGFENNFFLKIISTKKTPYTINELNDYLIKNNYVCDAVGFPASKNLKYFGNSLECMILYADDTNSANFKIITTRLLISETKVDNYFNPVTPEQLYKNIEGSYHQNEITSYSGLSNIDDNVIVIE